MELTDFYDLSGGSRPIGSLGGDYVCLCMDEEDSPQAIAANPPGARGEASFCPMPEVRRDVAVHLHVVGASGSGKSTFANEYARAFKRELSTPDRPAVVCVISADAKPDPNMPDVDLRLAIDKSLGDYPLEKFKQDDNARPVLIIMDDVEGLNSALTKAFRTFEQAVVERGRKMGIHSISIYHRGAANKSTAVSLGEATGFVVFPSSLTANTGYMLTKYAGIAPEIISLIRRGGWGRWLIVAPGEYLLGEKKAAILDEAQLSALAKAEKKRMNRDAARALEEDADEACSHAALDQLLAMRIE